MCACIFFSCPLVGLQCFVTIFNSIENPLWINEGNHFFINCEVCVCVCRCIGDVHECVNRGCCCGIAVWFECVFSFILNLQCMLKQNTHLGMLRELC